MHVPMNPTAWLAPYPLRHPHRRAGACALRMGVPCSSPPAPGQMPNHCLRPPEPQTAQRHHLPFIPLTSPSLTPPADLCRGHRAPATVTTTRPPPPHL
ncbi:Os04g0285601 [Oryza sativa Japonica Group]|uniref:Os04g0285601 protein n=1 Tax=Oryza sativa subsp. japonica TaxID=39947 RepID=A0A0N7KIS0_ORYSJ|nr:hypothetical protein EE612_022822 [Oryza sativa]BAS88393.1 Os04g0285601 [Oryza sativa Japonica Group]